MAVVWNTKRLLIFPASVWMLGPRLMYFVCLVPVAFTGVPLTPERLYVAVPLLVILGQVQLGCMYLAIHFSAEAFAGMKRFWMAVVWITKRLSIFPASVWMLGPRLMYFVCLIPVVFTGVPLTAVRLWIAVPLLIELGQVQLGCNFFAIQFSAELIASMKRCMTFLLLDELEVASSLEKTSETTRPAPKDCEVTVTGFTAKWDKAVEQNTLENLDLDVAPGKLLAVIGPVGAGKSSLLMSILGELPAEKGHIVVKGKISYASQQPWVFSASLRQNILFGMKYEAAKYDKIIRVCALKKDLDLMPHGDGTLIGDRGISLSGGQRARVSLARTLYTDSDIYLLDDPLSAVDSEVGRHIFEKVVMGYLGNKPRILVTHQLQYLTVADEILILKDGQTLGRGTFDELSQSGIDFSALLKRDDEEEETDLQRSKSQIELMRSLSHSSKRISEIGSTLSLESIDFDYEPEPVQLRGDEEMSKGTVSWNVYAQYFKAGANIFVLLLLVLINILAQVAFIGSDWWLSYWANQEEDKYAAIAKHDSLLSQGYNITNVTIPFVDLPRNVYIFTGITLAVFLFGLLRALLFFRIAISASKVLHNRMFASILRSKILFFDNNPVGRILNRFSKDVGHMDDNLPVTFFDFIQCFLLIVGIVIVSGVVNPWVFIPIIPLTIAFLSLRHYYIKTSRNIKRLEGTTRSPVFSHLSASLQGLCTIRSSGIQDKFIEEFDNHQDLHSEAWFLFITSSRWLAVRLDWLCAIFVSCVAFSSVLAADDLDAGLVGLSLTYAMTLMGMFQWAVRQSAEVENQMVSVERVLEYSNLPQEAQLESDPDHKPPADWPKNGAISGKDVGLRYSADSPLVLKHIDFTINAQEKVGIVGRTGAGKSSLLTVLFRLVEPEGTVFIDGKNISNIGLHDLRNKISIIPQDPTLFTGTVRRNLDPFDLHEDRVLWSALEEVQLKSAVEELPEGLEWGVSEGGINFSVGQRQLLCLARAILRKNKILVIDEATANVDPRTDGLIQETIRDKFAACTVLTIAHRLHTIMDSDRVLVLNEGQIVGFDEPYHLLQDKTNHFSKMVEQTGRAEMENLRAMAKAAHDDKVQRQTMDKTKAAMNNGTLPPVTIKLNDIQFAPMASPETSTLSRKPKQGSHPLAAANDKIANQNVTNIPSIDSVAVGNQGHPISEKDIPDEDVEMTEEDKLLNNTQTITI